MHINLLHFIAKTFESITIDGYTNYLIHVKHNKPTTIYLNSNGEMDDYLYNIGIICLQGYKQYQKTNKIFKLLEPTMKFDENYKNACQELQLAILNRRR